ncbi:general transcription factor IIIA, b [Aplochiton taeniatus]
MGERVKSQRSFICSFVACEATFNKSWKLEAHLCKHTGLKPFSCGQCDKSFCTRYQLARHHLSHSGEKPYKCLTKGCPEVFVTHASVKNHMARVHQHQEKRCSKEFPTSGKLKHHEKMHKGYPCVEEGCPFKGTTWTEYQKHRKQHRVKLQCDVCKKLFLDTWFLKQHQLHVHSEVKRQFKCPKEGCGKTFPKPFNLESHVLAEHEGKKAFSCAYPSCGKCFAMKESVWRHGVAHDPAKTKIQEETRLATRLRNTSL